MNEKKVSPESQYDPSTVTNSNAKITPALLEWWSSLNQQQKIWYCEIHPISDLTLGHLGQKPFEGWNQHKMRRYHTQQANDLKLCIIGEVNIENRKKLSQLCHLQLRLAAR